MATHVPDFGRAEQPLPNTGAEQSRADREQVRLLRNALHDAEDALRNTEKKLHAVNSELAALKNGSEYRRGRLEELEKGANSTAKLFEKNLSVLNSVLDSHEKLTRVMMELSLTFASFKTSMLSSQNLVRREITVENAAPEPPKKSAAPEKKSPAKTEPGPYSKKNEKPRITDEMLSRFFNSDL